MTLKGIGVSKGIGLGKTFIIKQKKAEVEKKTIKNYKEEIRRLEEARQKAKRQLEELQRYTQKNIGEDESLIFEVHQMMLQDEDFIGRMKQFIQDESINAEYAVKRTQNEYVKIFSQVEDPYIKERVADIQDISKRLINILTDTMEQSLSEIKESVIIVAQDLSPSETAQLNREKVLGFITEDGAETSHTAILARTMDIPAVVGAQNILNHIKNGDTIIFDGTEGNIVIHPDDKTKAQWIEKQKKHRMRVESLDQLKGTKSITKDGVEIKINANIGTPKDVEIALKNDAQGIGLFRSEFLYMNKSKIPSEEEQFKAYKAVLEEMQNKPVIIRTLDIGGDKEIPYLQISKELNPFLGYRAIRISLNQVDLFKTQLRALLRASIYGNLGIMFPMISTLQEVHQAKRMIEEVKKDLINQKIPFRSNIEIGVMIETPAAALISDQLAKEVDFFSIGTNDLTQYTIAVDRMNRQVAYLYNTRHPAVLKLIEMTIKNGHKENIGVGICGEAAADPDLVEIFVTMGIDELSVTPGAILEVRQVVQGMSTQKVKKWGGDTCTTK
ncbi:MAG: phosphoenolpyruvate--protein phosphotransferase [Epulopiscium sp.]|nr:phosphoenolpyruvate--protein phosphotransferase [Candidatus Epulonipiscium sp.]